MIIYTKLFKMALMVMLSVNAGCIDNDTIILNDPQIYDKIQLNPWLDEYFIEDKKFNNIENNLIYNDCLEVVYKYQYEKNGEIKYFFQDIPLGQWDFIDQDALNKGFSVKTFKLTAPIPRLDIDKRKQSNVSYEFFDSKNRAISRETTGVVANYRNIVIHNPRTGFFMPLFSSFP